MRTLYHLLYTKAMSIQDKGSRLDAISAQIAATPFPPVHTWHPTTVGEIDIQIDAQAHWFHEGEPILRPALVKLFSSILWHEEGEYFLVTPVEKLRIRVADVPFLINFSERIDGVWVATNNVGEKTVISADHPVLLRDYKNHPLPYLKLRYDLWARVNRSVYVHWVNEALNQADTKAPCSLSSSTSNASNLVLASAGYVFAVA